MSCNSVKLKVFGATVVIGIWPNKASCTCLACLQSHTSDDMQGQDGGQEVNSFDRDRGKLHNEVTSGASKLLVDSVSAQNSQG